MKIILLGAPGCGKGTLSAELKDKHNYNPISAGDLIRDEIKSGSALGNKIKDIVKNGGLVNDDIVNQLMKKQIAFLKSKKIDNVIYDGYPRTVEQAKYLDSLSPIDAVIEIVVDEPTLVKRISGRRICPKCKASFNVYSEGFKPKKSNVCDECGEKLTQRADDNPSTVKNRLKVYNETTSKLINFYKKQKKLSSINGVVFDNVMQKVGNILNLKPSKKVASPVKKAVSNAKKAVATKIKKIVSKKKK
ncbi:MAG: nucleoside monophosphate kinase [Mycoplasmataceae bacterium]|jgi:adenylate kinase|nr:nucleoside monophosphate kinase [Mycoplasmataceae bacterium]